MANVTGAEAGLADEESGAEPVIANKPSDLGEPLAQGENDTASKKASKNVQIADSEELPESAIQRKLCCGFMAPRELFENDRAAYVKRSLIELIIYVVFLGCLTFVAYGNHSAMAFTFNRLYTRFLFDKVFSDFSDSENYNLNTFRTIVGYSEYYSFLNFIKRYMFSTTNLLQQNVLIGNLRLRQVRVGNETFAFSSASELHEKSYGGALATYGGGGFNISLPKEAMALSAMLSNLKLYKWIDRGTRAIFFDFVLYNANVNIVFIVRLLAEFSPTSLVVTSKDFLMIRPLGSNSIVDMLEYVIYAFMALFLALEIIKIFNLGGRYWSMIWNYLDLAIILDGCCMILFKIFSTNEIRKHVTAEALQAITGNNTASSNSIDFRGIATMQEIWEHTLAAFVFLCWLKLFRYCNFTQTMSQAWLAFTDCAKDLVGFVVIFMIVFIGFSQFAYIVFGNHVRDFSTFGNSMLVFFKLFNAWMSLMKILMLYYDASVLREEVDPTLVLVFFFLFVFFVYFLMVTMFVAIIIDAYHAATEATLLYGREMEVFDFIGQMFMQKPHFLQWNARMIRLGYENHDIRTIIKRHRGQTSNPSLEKEMTLELEELSKSTRRAANRRKQQIDHLQRRIDQVQVQLSDVGDKLDATIARFKAGEFSKLRRKAVMEKLIDAVVEVEINKENKSRGHVGEAIKEELERLNTSSGD